MECLKSAARYVEVKISFHSPKAYQEMKRAAKMTAPTLYANAH